MMQGLTATTARLEANVDTCKLEKKNFQNLLKTLQLTRSTYSGLTIISGVYPNENVESIIK